MTAAEDATETPNDDAATHRVHAVVIAEVPANPNADEVQPGSEAKRNRLR